MEGVQQKGIQWKGSSKASSEALVFAVGCSSGSSRRGSSGRVAKVTHYFVIFLGYPTQFLSLSLLLLFLLLLRNRCPVEEHPAKHKGVCYFLMFVIRRAFVILLFSSLEGVQRKEMGEASSRRVSSGCRHSAAGDQAEGPCLLLLWVVVINFCHWLLGSSRRLLLLFVATSCCHC